MTVEWAVGYYLIIYILISEIFAKPIQFQWHPYLPDPRCREVIDRYRIIDFSGR